MAWDDDKTVNPGEPDGELTSDEWNTHVDDQKNHNTRHESGGVDEINVNGLSGDLADAQDPKAHSDTHGYGGTDELGTALKYDPESEPTTPTDGCVRWYDATDDAFKVKFSDGGVVTVAQL